MNKQLLEEHSRVSNIKSRVIRLIKLGMITKAREIIKSYTQIQNGLIIYIKSNNSKMMICVKEQEGIIMREMFDWVKIN